jgi:Flp pilus assembly protein TadB
MGQPFLVAAVAGLAVALLPRPRSRPGDAPPSSVRRRDDDWMRRYRLPLSLLAGIAALTFVGGTPGLVAAPLAAGGCWRAIGRAEPAGLRREREELRRELPHLARLLAAALAAGAAPAEAAHAVADALPGPGGRCLAQASARL